MALSRFQALARLTIILGTLGHLGALAQTPTMGLSDPLSALGTVRLYEPGGEKPWNGRTKHDHLVVKSTDARVFSDAFEYRLTITSDAKGAITAHLKGQTAPFTATLLDFGSDDPNAEARRLIEFLRRVSRSAALYREAGRADGVSQSHSIAVPGAVVSLGLLAMALAHKSDGYLARGGATALGVALITWMVSNHLAEVVFSESMANQSSVMQVAERRLRERLAAAETDNPRHSTAVLQAFTERLQAALDSPQGQSTWGSDGSPVRSVAGTLTAAMFLAASTMTSYFRVHSHRRSAVLTLAVGGVVGWWAGTLVSQHGASRLVTPEEAIALADREFDQWLAESRR